MALLVRDSWEPNFWKPTPSSPIKLNQYKCLKRKGLRWKEEQFIYFYQNNNRYMEIAYQTEHPNHLNNLFVLLYAYIWKVRYCSYVSKGLQLMSE